MLVPTHQHAGTTVGAATGRAGNGRPDRAKDHMSAIGPLPTSQRSVNHTNRAV
jgi:hypothetical protein